MKKYRLQLIGLLFFIVSALFIAFLPSFNNLIPAQQVELSHGVQYGAVLKDFLFVQEITMKQRYLSRVDVYIAKLPSQVNNSNVFVLIDDQKRILYTKPFSSADFGEALHFPFDFGKSFDIGKGRMVYACIYSTDGDQQSYIGLARKDNGKIGKLYVMPILGNDVLQSFANRQSVVDFKGTLGIRTYESDSNYFSVIRIIMYIMVLLISLIIAGSAAIIPVLLKLKLRPEYAFIVVSLIFGMIMLVITPPFQVPDEPVHFYRSYQVADFNFLKHRDDFPASLKRLSDSCSRMQFSTHEKTRREEILALGQIPVNPSERATMETPSYTIPYLPQAFGIILGKMMNMNPLWLLYLGRLFNLLATLCLVFLAIRVTPVFKWVFAILGILPMSLYQFASLSYDAGTIGLSFLLLALILKIAFESREVATRGQLIRLAVIALLLATSKPPYFLIILAFLVIPVAKLGSMKRYIIVFSSLVILALLVSQAGGPLRMIMGKLALTQSVHEPEVAACVPFDLFAGQAPLSHNALAMALPMLPHAPQNQPSVSQSDQNTDNPQNTNQQTPAAQPAATPPSSPFNPSAQKDFILANPVSYLGIISATLSKSFNLYVVSTIGLFGWIDTQVPDGLAYTYWVVLIFLSLFSSTITVTIDWRKKLVLLATFLLAFFLIETALYLYCNPVASPSIIAVQGRYFIALLPLLLLLFYYPGLAGVFARKKGTTTGQLKAKKQAVRQAADKPDQYESAFIKLFPLIALLFGILTLTWSVYLILDRFYILTI